jgi:hypothetical protein
MERKTMPDRVKEKLVELLVEFVEVDVWDNGEFIEKDIDFQKIASNLIANGVTVQEWISVKDQLPENKGNYLGFTGSTTMVGYYKGNGNWWIWLNDVEGENLFTHWMPLPEPPKDASE